MTDQSFIVLAKPNTGDYFEGSKNFLRSIYPRPVVSPARVRDYLPHVEIVFREDFYDPTTRIRRGRFYQRVGSFPIQSSRVSYAPYVRPNEVYTGSPEGAFDFQAVFEQIRELNNAIRETRDYEVTIGVAPAETLWRVIDSEGLSDGTTLFTLKSASAFGLLPVLKAESPDIVAAYEKVLDASLKYAPVPVVDVCRESAYAVLANKFGDDKDLSKLLDRIEENSKKNESVALVAAGRIINHLHPRGKSAEQAKQLKRGVMLRPVIDEDAILAVRLFGLLLIEIGYAVG